MPPENARGLAVWLVEADSRGFSAAQFAGDGDKSAQQFARPFVCNLQQFADSLLLQLVIGGAARAVYQDRRDVHLVGRHIRRCVVHLIARPNTASLSPLACRCQGPAGGDSFAMLGTMHCATCDRGTMSALSHFPPRRAQRKDTGALPRRAGRRGSRRERDFSGTHGDRNRCSLRQGSSRGSRT